ncbi:MAG: hypothetical protein H0W89_04515 [Candidatus Levybacteria bacterium]|nr:hypothetical protein [Candidatus Levybacteria bacterium]
MAIEKKAPVRDPLLPLTHYQRIGKQTKKEKNFAGLWILTAVVLAFVGLGAYSLHNEIKALEKDAQSNVQPTFTDQTEPETSPTFTPTQAADAKEGQFCGGVAAIQCSEDYICELEGKYPDAGGVCVNADEKTLTNEDPDRSVSSPPIEAVTICTQEATQCSDGSWVPRSGPNCEFKCPQP